MGLVPAAGVTEGCRCPQPVVPAAGVSGCPTASYQSEWGLSPSHWGGNDVYTENQLLGGPGMVEASKWLSARGWHWTVGHSPCAWCRLLGVTVCVFPKASESVCGGVFTGKLQAG